MTEASSRLPWFSLHLAAEIAEEGLFLPPTVRCRLADSSTAAPNKVSRHCPNEISLKTSSTAAT